MDAKDFVKEKTNQNQNGVTLGCAITTGKMDLKNIAQQTKTNVQIIAVGIVVRGVVFVKKEEKRCATVMVTRAIVTMTTDLLRPVAPWTIQMWTE